MVIRKSKCYPSIRTKYIYKIDWYALSSNPNAIHLLKQNVDKIDWCSLSLNPNAIHLLEQNQDKINWDIKKPKRNPSIRTKYR